MRKKGPNGPIDVVIPWVDGTDPEWNELLQQYSAKVEDISQSSTSITRFESWDNLKYVFRGIEKNMPWVNKIFFVTYGHLPFFLNPECPKLHIVKHRDYIPEKYLPTFNSNTIEINYHRIEELAENFILFNDDLIPIQPVKESYYLKIIVYVMKR